MSGPSTHAEITRYLTQVRRRALTLGVIRGGLVGLSAAAITLLACALWVGPVASPWVSVGAALLAIALLGISGWLMAFPHGDRRGAASLIDTALPGLGSRTLSAVELVDTTFTVGSPALVRAHADQTLLELRAVPVTQVVPFALRRDRTVLLSMVALLGVLVVVAFSTRARLGLHALTHPSTRDASGARVADVVEHVALRLRFPSYLAREEERVVDLTDLQVPRGTTVDLTIDSQVDADAMEIRVVNVDLPLQAVSSRQFHGSFVARESGALAIRVHHGNTWLRDRTPRTIVTVADSAPSVSIVTPTDGAVIGPEDAFELAYKANDDTGLMTVELVIRAPGGRELRRRLWTGDNGPTPQTLLTERMTLLASELMAKPGDSATLWLEATDRSSFDGPNRSRSAVVRIEIASDASDKAQLRLALRDVLDHMLDALAGRLEQSPSSDDQAARRRADRVFDKTRLYLESLDAWIEAARGSQSFARADQDAARSMRARHRQLLAEERTLHGARLAALATRVTIDRRSTEALEADALFIADLLGRAHLMEAEALAAELAQIRQQLTELMQRLESADNAEARQEILAAIARAQARLARLMQSLAEMADHVPGEFVNADALRSQAADNALSAMADALQKNDLKAAEQQLAELSRNVDQLQQALRDGTLSFTNDRFGERNRAMDSARSELAALAQEQQRLAQRSGQVLQRLGERWSRQHGEGPQTSALKSKADAARQALNAVDRSGLGSMEAQAFDRASQRLSDTSAALGTGDLLEAERMAGLAAESAQELDRDIDIMRRMFPGARGETARNAERAKRASSAIEGLRSALSQQTPDVAQAMNDTDGRELRADADPQQQVRQGTERLAQSLENGPAGQQSAPIHQEGAQGLRNAERAMQRAEQALRRGDPVAAAANQAEARDALEAARESMREQSGGQGGPGQPGGDGDGNPAPGTVQLPSERSTSAQALRQKLLEGMRNQRPAGYESAVERYYRELLE